MYFVKMERDPAAGLFANHTVPAASEEDPEAEHNDEHGDHAH